jgi:hypothetical protein
MLPQSVGANVRGGKCPWGVGKRGRGEDFANHRCVQVLQGGEPGNNFPQQRWILSFTRMAGSIITPVFRILSLWPEYRSSDSGTTPQQVGMRIWHNPWMTKRSNRQICNRNYGADMDLDPVPYPTIELQVNARKRQKFCIPTSHFNIIPIQCRYFLETLVDFDEFSKPEFHCFAF